MPLIEGQMPRKLLPIIYILDTSGSMAGERIASVNEAMRETTDLLKDVSAKNPAAELKIGILEFNSGAEWITKNAGKPGLIFMEDFFWNDLKAGGLTDLGSALRELDEKLSRERFLDSDVGYKVPVLIFMSDGGPTDDWEKTFNKIKSTNTWFKSATKIAVAVGDEANRDVLTKIADDNNEAVIKVSDNEELKKLIRVVSVTASMIGSKSKTGGNSQKEVIKTIRQEMKSSAISSGSNAITDPEDDSFDWEDDEDD